MASAGEWATLTLCFVHSASVQVHFHCPGPGVGEGIVIAY